MPTDVFGVQFNSPPEHLIPLITESINRAVAQLPPDADAALVGVADGKGGWNAAFVAKTHSGFSVQTWIGKTWTGEPKLDWGVQVMQTFKFRGSKP